MFRSRHDALSDLVGLSAFDLINFTLIVMAKHILFCDSSVVICFIPSKVRSAVHLFLS